jgi:NADH dehydrogenase/NADH:ubiquinone oxidoreductase subunit G
MDESVEIIVDDKLMHMQPHISLLQALRLNNISLPSLCFFSHLEPNGSCGLCLVEVYGDNGWRPKQSCLVQVENGLRIKTRSQRILELRARAARLLLKRGPFKNTEVNDLLYNIIEEYRCSINSKQNSGLALQIGYHPQYSNAGSILCGLCVKICRQIGKNQLVLLGRGENLKVGLVAGIEDHLCGRCSACRHLCPTEYIDKDVSQVFSSRLYR